MVQGTTPTFICTLPNTVDLTSAQHVYFTISQFDVSVEKHDSELTIAAHSVTATLTQAETLRFDFNWKAQTQINWTYSNGTRGCSNVAVVDVRENLHKAVIS